MKATDLIEMIKQMIDNDGDFDVIAAKDSEGNGYNDVRGVDLVYQSIDDPECIYDEECEAEDDCGEGGYEARLLVWV